ncbi:MAG: hypothetical protein KKH91_00895 [Elusimicrobia bacterium]|nr:hypothetical protein [Elusimicrobiota bacterium]
MLTNEKPAPRAIVLYSGGLDSTLAVLVLKRLGVEVIAVNFTTSFGCSPQDRSSCSHADDSVAEKFGFTLKYYPLGEEFWNIVKHPAHGYGKNMNPCIDCRILMLKEAKKIMDATQADFIATGEVLGQRPMSQHIRALNMIERESGLKGYLLRPLSAKLLHPTIPEQNGFIDRDKLLGLLGRTRKPQFALAKEFGLLKIPQPASGCLLTDPDYSRKLKDLLKYSPDCDGRDIELLKVGRHYRLAENSKLIIGRNFKDNCKIEKLFKYGDVLLSPGDDIPGPTALLLEKNINDVHIGLSAKIFARFSDGKKSVVSVLIKNSGNEILINAQSMAEDELNQMKI